MKKTIFFLTLMLLMVGIASAESVERSISGNTISYEVNGVSGKFGGIISETIPTGYSFGTFQSGLDFKLTGSLLEIPFTSTSLPTYTLVGSSAATISGSYALADNLGTGAITGDSALGGGSSCEYTNICDEEDSCQNTRDTDGIICATNKVCQSGSCVTASTEPECTSDVDCASDEVCQNQQCVDDTTQPPPELCPDGEDKRFWQNDECDGLSQIAWIGIGVVGFFVFMTLVK